MLANWNCKKVIVCSTILMLKSFFSSNQNNKNKHWKCFWKNTFDFRGFFAKSETFSASKIYFFENNKTQTHSHSLTQYMWSILFLFYCIQSIRAISIKSYYNFDEVFDDDQFVDLVGNHNATLQGGAAFQNGGKFNGCFKSGVTTTAHVDLGEF
jgi:hypothetical protein